MPDLAPERKSSYKLSKSIVAKPVAIDPKSGRYLSLQDIAKRTRKNKRTGLGRSGKPLMAQWLSDLEGEHLKALVVDRLRLEPAREVWILDKGVFSLDEIVEAVQQGSELGELFIRIEKLHVADLREKVESGEYQIPD